MTDDNGQTPPAVRRLVHDLRDSADAAAQAAFRVSDLQAGDVEYVDSDWDGSDAEASYPNPSNDDTDLDFLADHYVFAPSNLDSDDPPAKSAFKAPIRMGPGGPVNTNALLAVVQAINGARGGFDGISQDTLRDGYDYVVDHLVAAGVYDDAGDAPDFEGEAVDASGDVQDGFDIQATASAISVDPEAADGTDGVLEAADGETLAGVIWGAGEHDLWLNGQPTPVRVPEETVEPTYEAMQADMESSDVTLGFDHPDPDSIAAQTGIVDIGYARDAALSADGQYIVMTDSELTNDQARQAAEAGDFDDHDWSIVADMSVRRDDDGRVQVDDGRVVIDAVRINRVDAVDTGAVDAASIERDQAALPDLQDHTRAVEAAAAGGANHTHVDAADALRASASTITETMQDPTNFDPSDFDGEAAQQLQAAADVIEDQQEELEAAQAQASGFEAVMAAHDVDPDDFEDPEAAAQAVIDQQTESLREDIAELEASLPAYDVDDSDVEDRMEALAGSTPAELENELNARKAEAFDVQQRRQEKGKAAASGDDAGQFSPSGGQDGGDGQADEIALGAMDGGDRIQAEANDLSPAEYIQQEYGLQASDYDHADELHDDILAEARGDDA